eukprot:CAMPEP_0170455344 /NCGR_PEP_ID=MMETSP0123-20130129/3341_1 /TAXON_ID=182087 /ORGANISM="Favella ehrenbergii, Strain Fehren 1" /LENGTH=82 /DNA_ID=CAMNT_0010718453 /DNA_START=350 /DNA_END=598 /DNA_ORIENTATION=+
MEALKTAKFLNFIKGFSGLPGESDGVSGDHFVDVEVCRACDFLRGASLGDGALVIIVDPQAGIVSDASHPRLLLGVNHDVET